MVPGRCGWGQLQLGKVALGLTPRVRVRPRARPPPEPRSLTRRYLLLQLLIAALQGLEWVALPPRQHLRRLGAESTPVARETMAAAPGRDAITTRPPRRPAASWEADSGGVWGWSSLEEAAPSTRRAGARFSGSPPSKSLFPGLSQRIWVEVGKNVPLRPKLQVP